MGTTTKKRNNKYNYNYNNYPKLWEIDNDDSTSTATATATATATTTATSSNRPSRYMPSHIQPGTEESFAWARSVPRAYLRTSVAVAAGDNAAAGEGSDCNCTTNTSTSTSTGTTTSTDIEHENENETETEYKYKYKYKYKSLGSIFCSTFVIAQEFALSVLFLASHRCLICIVTPTKEEDYDYNYNYNDDDDDERSSQSSDSSEYSYDDQGQGQGQSQDQRFCAPCEDEERRTYAFVIFGITIIIIAIWAVIARSMQGNANANASGSGKSNAKSYANAKGNEHDKHTARPFSLHRRHRRRPRNKDRIYYRAVDAILIAGMLRFLSSVLRTLTASYSSDTVVALAVGGMVLHLLSCDYRFANGIRSRKLQKKGNRKCKSKPIPTQKQRNFKRGKDIHTIETEEGEDGYKYNEIDSDSDSDEDGDEDEIFTYEHGRPLFLGGTISINSVFFSAVLLASRCPTDSSSYIFLMETVILFAYYPEARHIMACTFGNSVVFCTLFTTVTMCTSSYLILDNNGLETTLFKLILFYILCVAPVWRWLLQGQKEIIGGPWEIAHLDSVEN